MNNSKKSMSKVGKYFREISVVVIGVAITLCAGYLINMIGIKRDVALNMNAIKIELERNATAFEEYATRLHKSTRYAHYVQTHDDKSISRDSVRYYANTTQEGIGWGEIVAETILIKNAFEMLKTSGTMRYVSDKELLGSIWEIYRSMENVQNTIANCFQMKKDLCVIELTTASNSPAPYRTFYNLGASDAMEGECWWISEEIRKVLSEWAPK